MTGAPRLRAMTLRKAGAPLVLEERALPDVGANDALLRVLACGVCRTDLHVVDGELPNAASPIIPGHEIVGVIERLGADARGLAPGQRVGAPWLGGVCGCCPYCASDRENLCDAPTFTGYTRDGGYATHAVVDARFCFPLDEAEDPVQQAPLLCAGLIGWRALKMAGDAKTIGVYGFGAAAHLLAQIARFRAQEIYAFVRPGDAAARDFALSLGAHWAGGSDEDAPEKLDAAIIFAPVGALVPRALANLRKGGIVVCGGIHMSDIPAFPYALLWEERRIVSVANLTRADAREFLDIAARANVRTHAVPYPLINANEALADLREGRLQGAAVLIP
jgi:alcohol dehydrogenase, propanol-preferring